MPVVVKAPAEMRPASRARCDLPGESGKPGEFGTGRAGRHSAGSTGEAADFKDVSMRIEEDMVVAAFDRDALVRRGDCRSTSPAAQDRPKGRFGLFQGFFDESMLRASAMVQAKHRYSSRPRT
jgi:hypothetical protein